MRSSIGAASPIALDTRLWRLRTRTWIGVALCGSWGFACHQTQPDASIDHAEGSNDAGSDAGNQDSGPSDSGNGLPAQGLCGCASIRDCFSELNIIAGTGLVTGGGANGWQSSFEGAAAIDVELSRPHMAQTDGQGNIYVADKDAHAIRKIDGNGILTTLAGMNEPGDDGDEPALATRAHLNQPNGLWVSQDGTVYALDLGNGKVRRIDVDGTMTTVFTWADLAIGRGLWVSQDGARALLSSQPTLVEWNQNDSAHVIASSFSNLSNLFVEERGIVVTERSAGTVSRIAEDGSRETLAGGGAIEGRPARALDARLPGLRAVWGDSRGGYFLGLHEGSRVVYLDPNGVTYPLLGPGEVDEVRSVALDRNGDLLVADGDGGFVKRLVVRAVTDDAACENAACGAACTEATFTDTTCEDAVCEDAAGSDLPTARVR